MWIQVDISGCTWIFMDISACKWLSDKAKDGIKIYLDITRYK